MREPIYAKAGDIFFTHSSTMLGNLIRWAESDPGEEQAWANHAGVVVASGWIIPYQEDETATLAIVVESLWRTERWAWWTNHQKEVGSEIRVYRKLGLTLTQVGSIIYRLGEFVGDKYGWWKLFAHLADRVAFKGKKTVSRLLHIDKRPICSYTAAKGFAAGGVFFGTVSPESADPDELMDYCEHSEEWVLVGGSRIEGGK